MDLHDTPAEAAFRAEVRRWLAENLPEGWAEGRTREPEEQAVRFAFRRAARHEGFAGTLTTLTVAEDPKVQALLGLPAHIAVAAIIPLGRPVRQLRKLKRKPVPEFAMLERWGGAPLTAARRA